MIDITQKSHRPFVATDPFNGEMKSEGIISWEADKTYGALQFDAVDGVKVTPRTILTTPKLEYPFTKSLQFRFPSATEIRSYKKYDGTNIFMYRYPDGRGGLKQTYKVRLAPFVRGRYVNMWQKMLAVYPDIENLYLYNPGVHGFSFELYGAYNPHLMRYDVPLDTVLLFAITEDGDVIPPDDLDSIEVPTAERRPNTYNKDYVWHYTSEQRFLDSKVKQLEPDITGRTTFSGDEGNVWYLKEKSTGKYRMYKCKATKIQEVHWASDTIDYATVLMTAYNVLETQDTIDAKDIERLLAEEFSHEQIVNSFARIGKAVTEINGILQFKYRIRKLIENELESCVDTKDIMRFLSKHLPKSEMRKAYSLVVQLKEEHEGR